MLIAVGAEQQPCSVLFAEPAAGLPPAGAGNSVDRAWSRFAQPPWTCQSPDWLRIDHKLGEDDLARKIARLVDEQLDLDPLVSSYAGRGSLPHRPDLLLKMVLYEHHKGRPQPTQWLDDLEKNIAVQWLTFGITPSRSVLYEFRDRTQPFLAGLNQQVIRTAIAEKHTERPESIAGWILRRRQRVAASIADAQNGRATVGATGSGNCQDRRSGSCRTTAPDRR